MAVQSTGGLLAGRYRIERPLGSGGMATVFLCEDERLGRPVAVKRMHAHSADEVALRFAREARLGASLNHPNLVSIFDTISDEDAVLIVMEYVKGETLADTLDRGPLPEERARCIVRDVAAALDHAHKNGVVHRDVKPGNILIRHDGVVKLVDLGIAVAADSTRITRSGIVLGTASYMSPEQLEGQPAGKPADIYALATVAFQMLSGRKAYTGRTPMEIAHAVATQTPPDLAEAWPEAPPRAAEVLRRGMARNPDDRPRSAAELAAELDRAFAPAPPKPQPRREPAPRPRPPQPAPAAAPAPAPAPSWTPPRGGKPARARRRPSAAAMAAVALLALALAAGAVALLAGGGDEKGGSEPAQRADRGDTGKKASGSGGAAGEQEQGGGSGAAQSDDGSGDPGAGAQQAPENEQQGDGGSAATSGGGATFASGQGGAAEGKRLNDQGYSLYQQRRYAEAIPILQRSVRAFPPGSTDMNYAFALYNLATSLRGEGRHKEAIPYLEKRLEFSDFKRSTVERELAAARQAAG